ncbi:PREDICTED: guanine nucleotide-binding protein subunit gamma 2 isoform X3 [Brassica oleracea var. oleracea]|uniref:guanine nucleotide-binding protein subunit gamma 2 isoform X3 n=1 Tax=Brassica oleracea var. oleracea TaxID=109376 RepID=UPI0006A73AC9|nr:PREDICTED: guanine nucleotide-binding protein subunit gamma 2 isoform X3 [Brassica oleracea var. oleracea]
MEVGSSNSSGQLSERVVDTRGKHRIHAQLNRLQQEARFLEVMKSWSSLKRWTKPQLLAKSSYTVLTANQILFFPLGPVNATWDQWFERPKEAKRCGCFIL